ncbi:MAG: Fic family protein [archaeon]|nr:MAG: Fic family protein [archaeon]
MGTLTRPRLNEAILNKWAIVDAKRPLSSTVVNKLKESFRAEYVYNTNAIEGNTLTLRETQLLIEEGITVHGKSLRELDEARNHPEALDYIENLATEGKSITEFDITTLHQILMKGTIEERFVGRYRTGQIGIRGSRHVPPPAYEVPRLMEEFVKMVNDNPRELTTVELAAVALHRLVFIHPFEDGNGRMSRLLANLVLLRKRYPPVIILNADRKRYLNYLAKADEGNYAPLVNFFAQYVIKHLDMILRALEQKPEDDLLTLVEAERLSSFSAAYLRVLANRGLISASKEGREWRISKRELLDYVRTHKKA